MTTVAMSEIAKDVYPFAPGVPSPAMMRAIRNAAIELCNRSLIHIYVEAAATNMPADTTQYTVTPPTGYETCQPVGLFINGTWVDPIPAQLLHRYISGAWPTADAGFPRGWYADTARSVRVAPKTDQAYDFLGMIALRPADDATAVEEFLFRDWRFAIRDGALSELLAMPNQTWTNATEQVRRERAFKAKVADAMIEANRARANYTAKVQLKRLP